MEMVRTILERRYEAAVDSIIQYELCARQRPPIGELRESRRPGIQGPLDSNLTPTSLVASLA